ncbi:hypothetical protein NMG60_11014591 [Bertholletia excelsa]
MDRGGGGSVGGHFGGFSHESEHDLAVMVTDFLESGSSGYDSWCSSDSDSGCSDLSSLADKILSYKCSMDQYENDLVSVVSSLILSIDETDHQFGKSDSCNARCIRFSLVKLLQSSGYDAAICATKWQAVGKIPGGEHEFIDVINHPRAIRSYDMVLRALPSVFVGSTSKLKQLLQAMAEAAKYSLRQNSMPLPPWRSLQYLQAKWDSTCQRMDSSYEQRTKQLYSYGHQQCNGQLRRLKFCIETEMRTSQSNVKQRFNPKNWRNSSFRTLDKRRLK